MAQHFIFDVGKTNDASQPRLRGFLDDVSQDIIIYDDTAGAILFRIPSGNSNLYLEKQNNLSDVDNVIASRTNLSVNTECIGCSFSGGGGVINISAIATIINTFGGTITSWNIAGGYGETGSCVIDLKKNGVSLIGAGNKPTISSGNSASALISGWTTNTIIANDVYEINIDSLSIFTRLTVLFYYNRT